MVIQTIPELREYVQKSVFPHLIEYRLVLLRGNLGSGKTTLVKELLSLYGVEKVTSPTYSIVQEYESKEGGVIYHLDLYRLKSEEEVIQSGIEEILWDNKLTFIEWPDIAGNLIPDKYIVIEMNMISERERIISITFNHLV